MTVDIIDKTNIDQYGVYTATVEHSALRRAFRDFWLINEISTGYMYDGMIKGKNCYALDGSTNALDLLDFALYKGWIGLSHTSGVDYAGSYHTEEPTFLVAHAVKNLKPSLSSLHGSRAEKARKERNFFTTEGDSYVRINISITAKDSAVTRLDETLFTYPSGKGGAYFYLKNRDITS